MKNAHSSMHKRKILLARSLSIRSVAAKNPAVLCVLTPFLFLHSGNVSLLIHLSTNMVFKSSSKQSKQKSTAPERKQNFKNSTHGSCSSNSKRPTTLHLAMMPKSMRHAHQGEIAGSLGGAVCCKRVHKCVLFSAQQSSARISRAGEFYSHFLLQRRKWEQSHSCSLRGNILIALPSFLYKDLHECSGAVVECSFPVTTSVT